MKDKTYKVICISLYDGDITALKERVAKLKERGWSGASKSHLIRIALSRLDDSALDEIAQAKRRDGAQ